MRPFHLPGTILPYVNCILYDKRNMIKCPMREPWACQPEPRAHGRVKVERTDEVTAQRYPALAACKAPQTYLNTTWNGRR